MRAGIWLILPFWILLVARTVAFGQLWLDVRSMAHKVYSRRENMFFVLAVLADGSELPALCVFFGPGGILLASLLVTSCGIWEHYWLVGLALPC